MKTGELRFFHGTASTNLTSILRDGLIPNKGKGGDYWMGHRDDSSVNDMMFSLASKKMRHGVYLAHDETWAKGFACCASMVNEDSLPVILEVRIPQSLDANLEEDIALSSAGYIFDGPIGVQYITGYKTAQGMPRDNVTVANLFDWPSRFEPITAIKPAVIAQRGKALWNYAELHTHTYAPA